MDDGSQMDVRDEHPSNALNPITSIDDGNWTVLRSYNSKRQAA